MTFGVPDERRRKALEKKEAVADFGGCGQYGSRVSAGSACTSLVTVEEGPASGAVEESGPPAAVAVAAEPFVCGLGDGSAFGEEVWFCVTGEEENLALKFDIHEPRRGLEGSEGGWRVFSELLPRLSMPGRFGGVFPASGEPVGVDGEAT